jgi:hypothetical protein
MSLEEPVDRIGVAIANAIEQHQRDRGEVAGRRRSTFMAIRAGRRGLVCHASYPTNVSALPAVTVVAAAEAFSGSDCGISGIPIFCPAPFCDP